MEFVIAHVTDFELSCREDSAGWRGIPWLEMAELGKPTRGYRTRTKLAYSEKGIYVLADCEDRRLSCSDHQDFDDLWQEDVVEVFLWPDQSVPLYFEFEISPLGRELTLLVPNNKGQFMGWRPWHYEGERLAKKMVVVRGGPQLPGAEVSGWTAEMFFPFELLRGLGNCPPGPGSVWKGNVFRMDYDRGERVQWALQPVGNGEFHRYLEFPSFRFL